MKLDVKNLQQPYRQENGRYLHAYKVEEDTRLRLSPKGFCNWCGKPLTGRSRYFCPPSEREIFQGYTKKNYWCTLEFMQWWTSGNPRFKRAVYIRDEFTCKSCGLRPVTTNKYGLELPDLSLLAIDHIYPYAKGGKTELENLQVLCRVCNGKKRDNVPRIFQEKQGQTVMDFSPSHPSGEGEVC